jgi:hypothetical protein
MKINKGYIIVGLIIAFTLFFELAAHADAWDETTTITFSEPIQIPGQTLAAGTYTFKLANSNADRNIVQVFDADGTHLYATLQTVSAERSEPTDDTSLTLVKPESGQPDVLLKWFYPGRDIGNEFLYSNQEEKKLAQEKHLTIVANQPTVSNSDATGAGN